MCELKRALFLDRDGVINTDFGHVHQIRDFEFMDGIFALCQSFQATGYLIVVVTNQAGIARGMYSQHDFHQLSEWMVSQFAANGVFISAVYFCPHHPSFGASAIQCTCRKPEPGMILRARADFNLDLPNSILIGDHESDISAARAAGVTTTVLLRSQTAGLVESNATYKVCNIHQVTDLFSSMLIPRGAGELDQPDDAAARADLHPANGDMAAPLVRNACNLESRYAHSEDQGSAVSLCNAKR